MYWVYTNYGLRKYFTHWDEAVAFYKHLTAYEKRLMYRTSSSASTLRHDIDESAPTLKVGRNGLRFLVAAG